MSGHNKWSKIKHKKQATDSSRSKEFAKMASCIKIEFQKSGGDANSPGVKAAVKKARSINMPNINIEKALSSFFKKKEQETLIYESFGPSGSVFVVVCESENKNKTASTIRHIFSKSGFPITQPNSVLWMFEKSSSSFNPKDKISLDEKSLEIFNNLKVQLEAEDCVKDVYTNII